MIQTFLRGRGKVSVCLSLRVFFVVAVSRAASCARVRALLSTAAHGGITQNGGDRRF